MDKKFSSPLNGRRNFRPSMALLLAITTLALSSVLWFSADLSKTNHQAEQTPADLLFLGDNFASQSVSVKNFPVEPVLALAREMAVKLQPGIRKPIEIRVSFRPENTPLASISRSVGSCTVILNSNPDGWSKWHFFFSEADKSEWMNIAELAIAHEIGHCADLESSQAAGLDIKKKSVLSGELFADVYASLYAQEWMGFRAVKPLKVLAQVREDRAWLEPSHDTGKQLRLLRDSISKANSNHEITPQELTRLSFELTKR